MAAGVAVWVLPITPARGWPVFAQLVAIDRIFVVLLCAVAAAAALIVWWRPNHRVRAAAVASGTILLAAMFGGRALVQGVADGSDPPAVGSVAAVSWNADGADPMQLSDALRGMIGQFGVDIVVLPETGWKSGELVHRNLGDAGVDAVVYAPEWTATAVLLSRQLADAGEYRVDTEETPPWAGLALVPARPSPDTPIIVATHLQQPSVGSTHVWRDHLDWVGRMCQTSPYVVVLGDMNATLNNLGGESVGGCGDVAASHGAGAAATWPTTLPSWLGVSIDRFMVGRGFDVRSATFRVLRSVPLEGTDHWPILVSFSPDDE